MITLLIYLIVFCLLFWLFYYVINTLAPEPFRKVMNVILVVVGCIILIFFLLDYAAPLIGAHGPYLPRR
jgi:hypothetical protein